MKTYGEKGFAEKGGMDESTRQRIQSKVTLAIFSFLVPRPQGDLGCGVARGGCKEGGRLSEKKWAQAKFGRV